MNFNEGAYIYINKPYRMSSFGALAHIRYVVSKRLKVKRVKMGHAGTLDPLATGVLILCTGKATKQIERLHCSWGLLPPAMIWSTRWIRLTRQRISHVSWSNRH